VFEAGEGHGKALRFQVRLAPDKQEEEQFVPTHEYCSMGICDFDQVGWKNMQYSVIAGRGQYFLLHVYWAARPTVLFSGVYLWSEYNDKVKSAHMVTCL
jgi:hypothetical protein